jgi:hypothetical protein
VIQLARSTAPAHICCLRQFLTCLNWLHQGTMLESRLTHKMQDCEFVTVTTVIL